MKEYLSETYPSLYPFIKWGVVVIVFLIVVFIIYTIKCNVDYKERNRLKEKTLEKRKEETLYIPYNFDKEVEVDIKKYIEKYYRNVTEGKNVYDNVKPTDDLTKIFSENVNPFKYIFSNDDILNIQTNKLKENYVKEIVDMDTNLKEKADCFLKDIYFPIMKIQIEKDCLRRNNTDIREQVYSFSNCNTEDEIIDFEYFLNNVIGIQQEVSKLVRDIETLNQTLYVNNNELKLLFLYKMYDKHRFINFRKEIFDKVATFDNKLQTYLENRKDDINKVFYLYKKYYKEFYYRNKRWFNEKHNEKLLDKEITNSVEELLMYDEKLRFGILTIPEIIRNDEIQKERNNSLPTTIAGAEYNPNSNYEVELESTENDVLSDRLFTEGYGYYYGLIDEEN